MKEYSNFHLRMWEFNEKWMKLDYIFSLSILFVSSIVHVFTVKFKALGHKLSFEKDDY
jgi:hypothetical protein